MPLPTPIAEYITDLRRGDETAVREFVQEYEPYIRRAIRPRIVRANLRAVADSADICQSTLGCFLIRVATGDFEVGTRQDLEKLLLGIARRKVAFLIRREYAERRDRNRVQPITDDDERLVESNEPAAAVVRHDLLAHVRSLLPAEEQRLFSMRQEGLTWEEISSRAGVPAILLRKRLSRALARVSAEFRMENGDE
jgi:DNA-directed RNA polymerase specialized sigma24 family protein